MPISMFHNSLLVRTCSCWPPLVCVHRFSLTPVLSLVLALMCSWCHTYCHSCCCCHGCWCWCHCHYCWCCSHWGCAYGQCLGMCMSAFICSSSLSLLLPSLLPPSCSIS